MKIAMGGALLALCVSAFAECPIQIGDSASALLASRGMPERRIDTGDGILLFYDTTLVFVTNGVVGFVSVSSLPTVAPAPVAPAAAPAPSAAQTTPSEPAAWEIMTAPASSVILEEQQRYQRLAGRARRFALSSAYASLGRDFRRALPLAAPATSGSLVGMKDSRGRALPAYGDTAWSSWYSVGVDLSSAVVME